MLGSYCGPSLNWATGTKPGCGGYFLWNCLRRQRAVFSRFLILLTLQISKEGTKILNVKKIIEYGAILEISQYAKFVKIWQCVLLETLTP